jgi:hypothetical protein
MQARQDIDGSYDTLDIQAVLIILQVENLNLQHTIRFGKYSYTTLSFLKSSFHMIQSCLSWMNDVLDDQFKNLGQLIHTSVFRSPQRISAVGEIEVEELKWEVEEEEREEEMSELLLR